MSRPTPHVQLDLGVVEGNIAAAQQAADAAETHMSLDGQLLDHPDARITALSEHHGTITGFDAPPGTRVRVVPNHVCTTVDLVDEYVVGPTTWPVDARGANT